MTEHIDKKYCYRYPHPAVTTDVVVFTISGEKLKLLLIKRGQEPFKGSWAIPGGFLEPDEDLDQCARRELLEETGLKNMYMEQLHTFGQPERDPRERVVSIAYYAIVTAMTMAPAAASDAVDTHWFALDNLPPLAFDHQDIVTMAQQRLISKLEYTSVAFQFLPETFTLSEAQRVCEILRSNKLDKRNFRRRITRTGLIEDTGEQRRDGTHRPARLYRTTARNRVQSI